MRALHWYDGIPAILQALEQSGRNSMTEQIEGERLYILGHPVAHSKSPVMYNTVYGQAGLPWTYDFADYAELDDARAFLRERKFLSINITTPYKPLAYESATRKDPSAVLAQGANVLVREGEGLVGYNTDGDGCVRFLELMGIDFADKRIVICGTGPTALSIMHACAVAGANTLMLLSRDAQRARRVLEGYIERFGLLMSTSDGEEPGRNGHRSLREAYQVATFRFGSYEGAADAIARADIVINATPLGMKAGDPAPFAADLLHSEQVVMDAVYAAGRTKLVADALAKGCTACNGGGMLVAQAVATARIVTASQGVELALSDAEMFNTMADAAGFDCPRA